MLVVLYAQYCISCLEDLSNYCEADCTLVDCSNGTLCMHHPKLTNYPAVIDPQARCLLILIKLKNIWRNIFKRKTEDRLVHGVLASPLGTSSNDNGDGDGNATASGETQKFHCAWLAGNRLTFYVQARRESSSFRVVWKRELSLLFPLLC